MRRGRHRLIRALTRAGWSAASSWRFLEAKRRHDAVHEGTSGFWPRELASMRAAAASGEPLPPRIVGREFHEGETGIYSLVARLSDGRALSADRDGDEDELDRLEFLQPLIAMLAAVVPLAAAAMLPALERAAVAEPPSSVLSGHEPPEPMRVGDVRRSIAAPRPGPAAAPAAA